VPEREKGRREHDALPNHREVFNSGRSREGWPCVSPQANMSRPALRKGVHSLDIQVPFRPALPPHPFVSAAAAGPPQLAQVPKVAGQHEARAQDGLLHYGLHSWGHATRTGHAKGTGGGRQE